MTPFPIAVVGSALVLATVHARPEFARRVPNGANVPGVEALGHADDTGASDKLNVFGKAFRSADMKWTTALCQADSDGDGQTNVQELGDPCYEWSEGLAPRYTDGVSDPGTKAKTADSELWTSINCSTATPSAALAAGAPHTAVAHAAVLLTGLAAVLLVGCEYYY